MLEPWLQVDEEARLGSRGRVADLLAALPDRTRPVPGATGLLVPARARRAAPRPGRGTAARTRRGRRLVRHTRPATLVGLALVALVGGFVVDAALVSSGQPSIMPSIVLGLVLLVIGGIVVTMACRCDGSRRARRRSDRRVLRDPGAAARQGQQPGRRALRGASGGVLAFMTTRGVDVAIGSVVPTIVAVVGGLGLLAAGIVAEHMCTVPPGDDEGGPGAQAA